MPFDRAAGSMLFVRSGFFANAARAMVSCSLMGSVKKRQPRFFIIRESRVIEKFFKKQIFTIY
jgi:hypothetical protein